jgi:hypothetical protein
MAPPKRHGVVAPRVPSRVTAERSLTNNLPSHSEMNSTGWRGAAKRALQRHTLRPSTPKLAAPRPLMPTGKIIPAGSGLRRLRSPACGCVLQSI